LLAGTGLRSRIAPDILEMNPGAETHLIAKSYLISKEKVFVVGFLFTICRRLSAHPRDELNGAVSRRLALI
jgi:hypothetical protein